MISPTRFVSNFNTGSLLVVFVAIVTCYLVEETLIDLVTLFHEVVSEFLKHITVRLLELFEFDILQKIIVLIVISGLNSCNVRTRSV